MKKVFAGLILVLSFETDGRVFAQQQLSSHDRAVIDLIKLTKVEQQMAASTEAVADAMTKGNPIVGAISRCYRRMGQQISDLERHASGGC